MHIQAISHAQTFQVYFKYVPLKVGIPILVGLFIVFQIRTQFLAHRAKKLHNLDEGTIQELAGDDDVKDAKAAALAKKQRRTKQNVKQRLAKEKKLAAKNGGKKATAVEEDDDGEQLEMFAKGSRNKKKQ